MTALVIALALGALCGAMIVGAYLLDKHEQQRLDREALLAVRQAQLLEVRETLLNMGATLAAVSLAAADAVESVVRFALERERVLRKRRT